MLNSKAVGYYEREKEACFSALGLHSKAFNKLQPRKGEKRIEVFLEKVDM